MLSPGVHSHVARSSATETPIPRYRSLLSLAYVFVFFWKYRDPKEMNRLGKLKDSELEYIREGGAQDEDAPRPNPLANLGYILNQRKVWGMSPGLGCAGYTQWMLLTWLPGYLQSEMGMSVMSSGIFTALPWLVAVAVEFIFPGWLLDHLMRIGKSGTAVRKTFIVAGMLLAMTVMARPSPRTRAGPCSGSPWAPAGSRSPSASPTPCLRSSPPKAGSARPARS